MICNLRRNYVQECVKEELARKVSRDILHFVNVILCKYIFGAKFTSREDGSVTSTLSRANTHSDEYLNFACHHHRCQNLGVVRSVMNISVAITMRKGPEMKRWNI